MSTFTIERATAAPAGDSVIRQKTYHHALLLRVQNFMLEDIVDAILAKRALADPKNVNRLSWEKVKEDLGL
jgi:hypothetical protein